MLLLVEEDSCYWLEEEGHFHLLEQVEADSTPVLEVHLCHVVLLARKVVEGNTPASAVEARHIAALAEGDNSHPVEEERRQTVLRCTAAGSQFVEEEGPHRVALQRNTAAGVLWAGHPWQD